MESIHIDSEQTDDGIFILKLSGRMDLDKLSLLDESLKEILKTGSRSIVVQMIDVTDISSSGIGKLLQMSQTLESKKGRMVLADLPQVVEYVLDLARLTDVFHIYPTTGKAVQSFR